MRHSRRVLCLGSREISSQRNANGRVHEIQLEAKNLKMAFRTIFFSSRENQRQRSARIMATLRQNQKRSLGRIRVGVFTRRFERAQSRPSKRLQRPTGPFLERTHPKAMRKSRRWICHFRRFRRIRKERL